LHTPNALNLQSNDYQVYANFAAANEKIISVGCWVHAQQKFKKAVKVSSHPLQLAPLLTGCQSHPRALLKSQSQSALRSLRSI